MNVRTGPYPSVRATSASVADVPRRAAATGSSTYGVVTTVSTSHEGQNPLTPGSAASHPNAARYDGTASGSTAMTARVRGAGSRTRLSRSALVTPITVAEIVTDAASSRVFARSVSSRGRVSTAITPSMPASAIRTPM